MYVECRVGRFDSRNKMRDSRKCETRELRDSRKQGGPLRAPTAQRSAACCPPRKPSRSPRCSRCCSRSTPRSTSRQPPPTLWPPPAHRNPTADTPTPTTPGTKQGASPRNNSGAESTTMYTPRAKLQTAAQRRSDYHYPEETRPWTRVQSTKIAPQRNSKACSNSSNKTDKGPASRPGTSVHGTCRPVTRKPQNPDLCFMTT